jgi:hypothetical protein
MTLNQLVSWWTFKDETEARCAAVTEVVAVAAVAIEAALEAEGVGLSSLPLVPATIPQ